MQVAGSGVLGQDTGRFLAASKAPAESEDGESAPAG